MNELEVFVRLAFLGLGALMFSLSLMSFASTREPKIGFAATGFGLFTAEGLLMAGGVFSSDIERHVTTGVLVGINFVALIFLYLSTVKR